MSRRDAFESPVLTHMDLTATEMASGANPEVPNFAWTGSQGLKTVIKYLTEDAYHQADISLSPI